MGAASAVTVMAAASALSLSGCFGSKSDSAPDASVDSGRGIDSGESPDAFRVSDASTPPVNDALVEQDASVDSTLPDAPGGDAPAGPDGGDASVLDAPSGEDAGDAAAATDGPTADASEAGSGATVIATELGLYYGGCLPLVASGEVFFCSAPTTLDGTQAQPDPSLALKSVPVTGGTPATIGTVVTTMCDPLCDFGQGSAGLYADATHLYWIDEGAGGANTTITLNGALLSGGNASPIASYTNGALYANDSWAFDGTMFFGGYGGERGPPCMQYFGVLGLPLDGGAPSTVVPEVTAPCPDGGGDTFDIFDFPGADPGPGGNIYWNESGDNFANAFVTRIPKSGAVFNLDAGVTGGFPVLAPNLTGPVPVGLASDGTNAYALEWLSASTSEVLLVPPNGSSGTILASIPSSTLNALYVDSGNVYWITANRTPIDGGVQITGTTVMRVATSGAGTPGMIYDASSSALGAPTTLAFDATYAYLTTALGNLVRVPK